MSTDLLGPFARVGGDLFCHTFADLDGGSTAPDGRALFPQFVDFVMSDLLESQLARAATLEEKIDALNTLARELRKKDAERALSLSQQAYDLASASERGYPKGVADSLYNLAGCHYSIGNMELALSRALDALAAYKNLEEIQNQAATLGLLGRLYVDLGDYPTALDYHLQRLAMAEQAGDALGQAGASLNMGVLYSDVGNSAQAIVFYEQALTLYRRAGHVEGEARTLNSCCVDYTCLGNYARALEDGFKSLQLFEKSGDEYGQGVALSSVGEAFAASGELDKALESFFRALDLLKRRSSDLKSIEALSTLQNIGETYLRKRQLDLALKFLQQTATLAAEASLKRIEFQCHRLIAQACELEGDAWKALEHYKQFHAIKEMVFNQESDRKLKSLEVLHRTRQAQAEAERQKQLREQDRRYFENLAQMKDDFISAASHDLKNPLSCILMATELLQRRKIDNTEEQECLDLIKRNASRMRHLIGDILDLAKLETGRALNLETIAAMQFLRDVIWEHEPAARSKTIHLNFCPDASGVFLRCDPAQIHRALDNLISNAIKYTSKGGCVNLVAEQTDALLTIKVIDNGVGIPPEAIPHLFERFYRVQRDDVQVEGTGLGLAIAKSIVEQHGSTLWVESEPGKGSVFGFSLPLVPPPASPMTSA